MRYIIANESEIDRTVNIILKELIVVTSVLSSLIMY